MRALPSRSGQSSVEADNAVGREGLGWSLFSEENEEPEVLSAATGQKFGSALWVKAYEWS